MTGGPAAASVPGDDAAVRLLVTPNYRHVIFLMGLCQLVLTTDFSIVSVALPTIGRSFGAQPSTLSWIVSATALTFAGFLVLGGRFTDIAGQRRALLGGLALFGIGSICSAAAPSIGWLIGARALQGLGAALLSPSSFSLINTLVPEGAPRHRALGIFGMMQGLSVIIGLVVGGFLTTSIGWRSVFLLNVPAIAVSIILVTRLVPGTRGGAENAFSNLPMAGAITIATALLLWSLSLMAELGPTSRVALGMLLVAALGYAGFFLFEMRAHNPLVPRAIYTPALIAGCIGGMGLLAGVGGLFIMANLYMQTVLRFSAAFSGIGMLPYALSVVAAGQIVPALLARTPVRLAAIAGFVLNIGGLLVLAISAASAHYVTAILVGSILAPLGSLVAFMSLMGDATASVSSSQQGLASAVLFTCQQIGLALGGTICLSVIAVGKEGAGLGAMPFALGYFAAAGIVFLGLLAIVAPRTRSIPAVIENPR